MLEVRILGHAAKSLKSLIKKSPKIATQIAQKISELQEIPEPASSSGLVGYTPLRCVRVDKYRIVYKHDGKVLKILLIEKRDKVYQGLPKIKDD
jgi:mRNA-degrading endonuclease RelE of RelBE toxin-antitoxin system